VKGIHSKGAEPQIRKPSDDEPFSGLVFKIMTDPFVGQLAFFRVYSGRLKTGSTVYNSTRDSAERVGRLLKMHANKREEIQEVYAGDIAAAVGLKSVTTGDTICDRQHPIVLEAIEFPAPVISVAIEPKTKSDQDKLGLVLDKLIREDPTFKVHVDQDTRQTIISGMGELHLEILTDRMIREFDVAANVGKPQVAYRETIRQRSEGEGRFIRQTGAEASTVTPRSSLSRWRKAKGLNLRTRSSEAIFPASSSVPWRRAWKRPSRAECWRAMRWSTSR